MIKDFETLKEKAKALRNTRLANIHRANNGSCSMNMINCKNGKRISFSKMLSIKLDLQDSVDIVELELISGIADSKRKRCRFLDAHASKVDCHAERRCLVVRDFSLNVVVDKPLNFLFG